MEKRKKYKVIQKSELQVWNDEKQTYETVTENASFCKQDGKLLFIGQSARKCTVYAVTDKGLIAGPSMFTKADYLGGAFLYSKGRDWFMQFQNSDDVLFLGRDVSYLFNSGFYVIDAYDAKRRDWIVFLYFPQTQVLREFTDTYYQFYGDGLLLRKGRDYSFINAQTWRHEVFLGRYVKEGDFFWRRCACGFFIAHYDMKMKKWETRRCADLSMYEVLYCFNDEINSLRHEHRSRIAYQSDGSFDIITQEEKDGKFHFASSGFKDYKRGVCLILDRGDARQRIPMRVIIGCPSRNSAARYNKVFEGEVYLLSFNLIVVKREEWFVLYHISRNGTLTEIERSEKLDYNPGKFFCNLSYSVITGYPEIDYWGSYGIKQAKETKWCWTLNRTSKTELKRSWWRRLFSW